mgnify:CR=1 FL=1
MSKNSNIADFSEVNGHLSFERNENVLTKDPTAYQSNTAEFGEIVVS